MYRNSKYFSSSSITKAFYVSVKYKRSLSQAIIDHMYYYIGYNYIDSRLETSRKDHTVN